MHAPLSASLQVEWRTLESAAAIVPEWRALADRALVPNVFYEPAFALAAAPVFGRDVTMGVVWSRAATPRLLGLFPVRTERRRYGVPLPVLTGWTHPFAPLGTPLVDRDAAEAVIAAWLGDIDANSELPSVMLLPYLPQQGPFADAFAEALARRGLRERHFGAHRRALLVPGPDRGDYIERAVPGRKLKELHRLARRLDESGAVGLSVARERPAIATALQDFLTLEADGWKGRAGSAARDDDAVLSFMRAAVGGLAAEGKASVHRLCSGGAAVAAGIVLSSGATAWFWKIAYDEAKAKFSPGVLLTLELTDTLLADPRIAGIDSCATPDHPMIDHLWRERLPLSDRLLPTRAGAQAPFALAARLEALRRGALGAGRRLRRVLRR